MRTTRTAPTLLVAALIALAAPAVHAEPRFKLIRKLSIAQRSEAPSFSPAYRLQVMDQGRLLHTGQGLWAEQPRQHFVDLVTGKDVSVTAPLAAYLKADPAQYPNDRPDPFPRYMIQALASYDTSGKTAGLLVLESGARTAGRALYLHWDLGLGKITAAHELGRKAGKTAWISARPVGYSATRRETYVMTIQSEAPGAPQGTYEVGLHAVGPRKRLVASFPAHRPDSAGPFFDPSTHRVAVVEYRELAADPQPVVHVVDLVTGQRTSVKVPLVTYGLAFDPDGKTIHVYSSLRGEVWTLELASGSALRKQRIGMLGFALGLVKPDLLLQVRHQTLHFLDRATLKPKATLQTRRFVKGTAHLQGSIVRPGAVVIKNGDDLYLVDLP
jgi:hypothetical protein